MDTTAPDAIVLPIDPDPRAESIPLFSVQITEAIVGFRPDEIDFRRDGTPLSISAVPTVEEIQGLTSQHGTYTIEVLPDNITDEATNSMIDSARETFTVDMIGPIGFVEAVRVDEEGHVDSIVIRFDEPVNGFSIDDVEITQNGSQINLSARIGRLTSMDRMSWRLESLSSFDLDPNAFTLQVSASTSGIVDLVGNALREDVTNDRPALPTGDFSGDNQLTPFDIDLLYAAIRSGSKDPRYDLNGDGKVDKRDAEFLVEEVIGTSFGDATFDGRFDSSDLVRVFQRGEYEDDIRGNSTWEEGDWDGDGEFGTGDLVLAFQRGSYESGDAAVAAKDFAGAVDRLFHKSFMNKSRSRKNGRA